MAGDVFDRAVPPAEAVALLDDFLTRIAALGVPLVLIAGNHDSAERLAFGSRLLEGRGIHLRGAVRRAVDPVEVPGKGFLYLVPYLDPEVVRGSEQDDEVRGHAAATDRVLARVRADAARRALPTVLVAHAFVLGAAETPDSERPLSVGGTGGVPAAAMAGFDYVALGHLHAPQDLAPGIRYSGSLLKYSFSEADQRKSVAVVEVERTGTRVETLPLGARRDVVRLEGTVQELLARRELAQFEGALVEATLDDEGYVLDAKSRLQARFPHVLSVVRRSLSPGGEGTFARRVASAGGDDLKLFDAFFETVAGAAPGGEQRAVFADALAAVVRRERAA